MAAVERTSGDIPNNRKVCYSSSKGCQWFEFEHRRRLPHQPRRCTNHTPTVSSVEQIFQTTHNKLKAQETDIVPTTINCNFCGGGGGGIPNRKWERNFKIFQKNDVSLNTGQVTTHRYEHKLGKCGMSGEYSL